jgi:predicted DNA binding CopG/RHH family protein
MKLSKNNQKVIDSLRDKQLTYLIKPFKKMVELDKLGKIKIHKMTWKVIMREVYNKYLTRSELEKVIISHLVSFGVLVVKKKRNDPRKSKERVKKHREDKKVLGYTQLSVLVSKDDLERLKRFKTHRGMTYQELLAYMIKNLPVRV